MGQGTIRHNSNARTEHLVTYDEDIAFRRARTYATPAGASESGDAPGGQRASTRRLTTALVSVVALVAIAWLLLILLFDDARFVVVAPRAKTGFEILLAVGQLFGALVLGIFPNDRMRWAAVGLFTLGAGALGYAYLYPLVVDKAPLETLLYGSGMVRSASLGLIALGLWPRRPPAFTWKRALGALGAFLIIGTLIAVSIERLPSLLAVAQMDELTTGSGSTLPGLTAWHWILAPIPVALGIMATVGAIRHFPGEALGGWLVAAIALMTGAQLHSVFWPSIYSLVITSASFFRLAFTLVLVTGGILELRTLLAQRDALLAEEQERLRRLEELGRMKDDFTAIVAHELASPVGAVSALADVLTIQDLPPEQRRIMADALQMEARMLHTLVADVQAMTAIERDDFTVDLRPVRIEVVVADVIAFASTIGDCRIETEIDAGTGFVRADPERIGQVLRNLLSNACKHTPPESCVVIRTRLNHRTVRVEVADDGPGIAAEDQERIFEKFARGHDRERKRIRGRGLGLYISRRIVQLHGSDLRVESEPGQGACFAFDLEVTP
jgi:signal transduction histidine kinase